MSNQHNTPAPNTLQELLGSSSDYFEEEAEDFLQTNDIVLLSHNRDNIYTQAWEAGWRPSQ